MSAGPSLLSFPSDSTNGPLLQCVLCRSMYLCQVCVSVFESITTCYQSLNCFPDKNQSFWHSCLNQLEQTDVIISFLSVAGWCFLLGCSCKGGGQAACSHIQYAVIQASHTCLQTEQAASSAIWKWLNNKSELNSNNQKRNPRCNIVNLCCRYLIGYDGYELVKYGFISLC